MTPRRIVLHTPEPKSGAARYATELALALAQAGAPVHLVCPANFAYLDRLQGRNISFSRMPARRTEPRTLVALLRDNLQFLFAMCRQLFTVLRKGDVIHFQFPLHFPFGMLQFVAARLTGTPIVFTAHDPVPHKWILPRRLQFAGMAALRCAYSLSSRLIVHNVSGLNILVNQFGQKREKISIIPHGPFMIDGSKAATIQGKELRLLVFGAIRENKGVHLAIEAIQRLAAEGLPVRLTIAGQAENAHERAYWSRCRELLQARPEGIQVIDRYIGDEEIPGLFAGTDCVLLPYHNFGSESGVARLALSNGKPIIATAAGGLGDLLEHAEAGFLIAEASPAGVAGAIRSAFETKRSDLLQMGNRGAAYLRDHCSWADVAESVIAVYRSIPLVSL